MKHGQGKWKSSKTNHTCSQYEGQYYEDKKHGLGVFTWSSGNIYKGSYHDDERHGQGTMRWTDGSFYEGQWQTGIQHGIGKMVMPNGQIKEGIFENNVWVRNIDDEDTEAQVMHQ